MCGIAFAKSNNSISIVDDMLRLMKHRGPDSSKIISIDNHNLAFGFNRLSIQDLSNEGEQPFFDQNQNLYLLFNGEIYNKEQLKTSLEEEGFSMRTNSDTEVIFKGYQFWGIEVFKKLEGIFSIVIYDKVKDKIFFGRDVFGVKPLYYYLSDKEFIVCSELKPIYKLNSLVFNINSDYFKSLMLFGFPFDGETPFNELLRFNKGEIFQYDLKSNKLLFLYKIELRTEKLSKISLEEKIFNSVVENHIGDVRVSYSLSGGLDSSLIRTMAKKHKLPNEFSYVLNDSYLNKTSYTSDFSYALSLCNKKKLNYKIVECEISEKIIIDYSEKIDEPILDTAALNMFFLTKKAHDDGYKVMLSGIGADEYFLGYRRHLFYKIKQIPFVFKFWNIISNNHLVSVLNENLDIPQSVKLFVRTSNSNIELFKDYILRKSVGLKDNLETVIKIDQEKYLEFNNLNYADKIGMLNSVEVRVPFLSKNICLEINEKLHEKKLNFLMLKFILKKIALKYLPIRNIIRSKTGFGIPQSTFINKIEITNVDLSRIYKYQIFGNDFNYESLQLFTSPVEKYNLKIISNWLRFTFCK